MKCPECGKPMEEQVKFKGLWICPDGKTPLNDRPPFKYKCNGIRLTKKGSDAFDRELRRVILESN